LQIADLKGNLQPHTSKAQPQTSNIKRQTLTHH